MSVATWSAVILVLGVLGWGLLQTNKSRPEETAPDFQLQFFDGFEWQEQPAARLSDLRGQVVVLNFWAAWCVECHLEAELLEQASRQYRDRGVVFLGVAYLDPEPNSLNYLERYGITYPNAPDLRATISRQYKITGVPETFFIDKEGEVAEIVIGPVNQTTLSGILERLLAEGY